MWMCRNCHEEINDSFEVCWNCGTSIDGESDPGFVAVKDFVPKDEPAPIKTEQPKSFEEISGAFFKGGCGCTIAFAVIGFLVGLAGGSVYIDPGGFILLYMAGGVIGLIVLAIYTRGKNAR